MVQQLEVSVGEGGGGYLDMGLDECEDHWHGEGDGLHGPALQDGGKEHVHGEGVNWKCGCYKEWFH